jgi:hypothetical protein
MDDTAQSRRDFDYIPWIFICEVAGRSPYHAPSKGSIKLISAIDRCQHGSHARGTIGGAACGHSIENASLLFFLQIGIVARP